MQNTFPNGCSGDNYNLDGIDHLRQPSKPYMFLPIETQLNSKTKDLKVHNNIRLASLKTDDEEELREYL